MERIFLIVVEIIAYMWIGYFFGRWSWNTYREDIPGWLEFILWPWTVGFDASPYIADRGIFPSIDEYAYTMMFFWGPKLLWNVIACIVIPIIYVLGALIVFGFSLITYPPRLFCNYRDGKKTRFFII